MPTLVDLLQRLATDPDLREAWTYEDRREQILSEYDLSAEQINLIRFAIDENRPYAERQRAVGQAVESQFGSVALALRPPIC